MSVQWPLMLVKWRVSGIVKSVLRLQLYCWFLNRLFLRQDALLIAMQWVCFVLFQPLFLLVQMT